MSADSDRQFTAVRPGSLEALGQQIESMRRSVGTIDTRTARMEQKLEEHSRIIDDVGVLRESTEDKLREMERAHGDRQLALAERHATELRRVETEARIERERAIAALLARIEGDKATAVAELRAEHDKVLTLRVQTFVVTTLVAFVVPLAVTLLRGH